MRSRDGDRGIVRHDASPHRRRSASVRATQPHVAPAPRPANAVFDVVAEHVQADLVGDKADLRRADQAAGVVDQPHRLQRRGVVACSAARRRALPGIRPSRRAARWCGCRHRARGGRPAPFRRRPAPAQSQPRAPRGRRRRRRHRTASDVSVMTGTIDASRTAFQACPPRRFLRGASPQRRMCKSRQFLIALRAAMDESNQRARCAAPAHRAPRVLRACLHGARRRALRCWRCWRRCASIGRRCSGGSAWRF